MTPRDEEANDGLRYLLIGADEFRVMLDVFEKHVAELNEAQRASFCWDPMDIPLSFRDAKILKVIVACEKPEEDAS